MKKLHPFIVIGSIGLFINTLMHLVFFIQDPIYFSYYTPWFVFLTIGLALHNKANKSSESQ